MEDNKMNQGILNKSRKKTITQKKYEKIMKEYCLKINNFNPMKGSPNLFMTKLEFRLKNYETEFKLNSDSFNL